MKRLDRAGIQETKYKVFDNSTRTDSSHKKNRESDFEFYNRSSRPAIERVRQFIEKCVKSYPKSNVKEFVARIRSGDDVHFRSASFELFLHEALIRKGCQLTVHPEISTGCKNKPDFLVITKEEEKFYLEAVLAKENNELNKSSEALKGVVLDTLAASPHHNFYIALDDKGNLKSAPSSKKLKLEIHRWLDSLNVEKLYADFVRNGLTTMPFWKWSYEDWNIRLQPIPINPERRGMSNNLVGIGGIGGGWRNCWSPIRDAVKNKGGKFRGLDKPLIVSINFRSFDLQRIDEMQALFGQEQIVCQVGSNSEPEMQRARNGAWLGRDGPQYTGVSAAWIFNNLQASSLAKSKSTVYLNPWATNQAPELLKIFPHAIANENKMYWNEGISLKEVLGLHEDWPGSEK